MIKEQKRSEEKLGRILAFEDGSIKCEGYNLKKDQIIFSIPIKQALTQNGLDYAIGDIIHLTNSSIRTLFYNKSLHNAFFITENCNNNCLMCSQPPLHIDDSDYLFNVNDLLLELLPENTETIGITGGEPTLHYQKFVTFINKIRTILPNALIHILSNGRIFQDFEKVKLLASNNDNIVVGVPLHSDIFYKHDFIAQAKGSFYQTTKGLYNLTSYGIRVEIRIVINHQNYKELLSISDFIYKNLPFVEHIAFMGLEYIGNAIDNFNLVDVSPYDYMDELASSVLTLKRWGLNVSVYNVPLCMLKPCIFEFAKKSISDWKQKYLIECDQCLKKNVCCGLFKTSIKDFSVRPILI